MMAKHSRCKTTSIQGSVQRTNASLFSGGVRQTRPIHRAVSAALTGVSTRLDRGDQVESEADALVIENSTQMPHVPRPFECSIPSKRHEIARVPCDASLLIAPAKVDSRPVSPVLLIDFGDDS